MTSQPFDPGPQFQPVVLEDLDGLDLDFYSETTQFLEAEGFRQVGDVEDLTATRRSPSQRTCIRLFVEPSGTTLAAIYRIPTSGFTSLVKVVTSLQFVEFQTEWTRGDFLSTTNNGFGEQNLHVDTEVDLQAEPKDLLSRHRDRVQNHLERDSTTQVRPVTSLGEALEAQQRQHHLKTTPPKLSPRAASAEKPRWFANWRQKVHEARFGLACFIAWILLGVLWGLGLRQQEHQRFQDARHLTFEEYEQQQEEREAKRAETPGRFWLLALFAGFGVMGFFVAYEGLRLGIEKGLGYLTRPDTHGLSTEEAPGVPRRLPSSAAVRVGKWALILGASFLLAFLGTRPEKEGPALDDPENLEARRERYEAYREEELQPPTDDASYLLGGILVSGLVVGAYEFAGGVGAVAHAFRTGGMISLGRHVLLSTLGPLFLFLAVTFSYFSVRERVEESEHWGFAPIIPFVVGLLLYWAGHRFLEGIPVPCGECGGRSFLTSPKPATYTCQDCGHAHRVG